MLKIKLGYLMVDHKIKSIAELSRRTSIHRDTLRKLVNDERAETITLENLIKLCDLFQCTLNDLIEYTPEPFENDKGE